MMTLWIFDGIGVLASLVAVCIIAVRWRRARSIRVRALVAMVAGWSLVHSLSNVLEANNPPPLIGSLEDYIQMMGPICWAFFFYGFLLAFEMANRKLSEERLTMALDAVNDAIWEWNPGSGEVYFSPRWYTMLGYRAGELPQSYDTWKRLVHPDDAESTRTALMEHLETGSPFQAEFRLKGKDGTWRWILGRGRIVERDERGRPVRMLGTNVDITGRMEAEVALLAEANRRKTLMEISHDGIAIFNQDHQIVEANKRFADMLGYTQEELLTIHTWDFEHLMSEEEVRAGFDDLSNVHHTFETQHRRKDGSVYDAEVSAAGTVVGDEPIVLTITRDITERKQAEMTLRQSEQKLKEVQRMSGLGHWVWDIQTGKVEWSEEVYTIFGLDPETFVPDIESILALSAPWPEDQARDKDLIRRAMENREQGQYDQKFLRPDGSVGHYHSTFQGEYDDEGYLLRIKGSVLDVTERNRAIEEAEAASRAKSEFLANMSHEIRTPLNGLMGMLQLMNLTELDGDQKQYVDQALESSRRLTRLLGDILDLSRVEAGKMTIAREPFDLRDAMESIAQLFRPSAREKGLDLELHVDPGIPETLLGDAARIQQVLGNFVGNAVKFTIKGRIDIHSHFIPSDRPDQCRVLFSVADTGIGIPDDMVNTLFLPFAQKETRFARTYQGAGLGLTISRRLVSLLGGTVAVESEEDSGSVFHFCVPFAIGGNVTPQVSDGKEEGTSFALKVLVAEDDPTSAQVTTAMLRKLGHRVSLVDNGKEVLAALREEPHDLVFMDVQMPLMDGYEATRAIRRGEAGEERGTTPIVAMTAYAMAGDRDKFLKAGMDGYLSKPVEMEQLRTVLEEIAQRVEPPVRA